MLRNFGKYLHPTLTFKGREPQQRLTLRRSRSGDICVHRDSSLVCKPTGAIPSLGQFSHFSVRQRVFNVEHCLAEFKRRSLALVLRSRLHIGFSLKLWPQRSRSRRSSQHPETRLILRLGRMVFVIWPDASSPSIQRTYVPMVTTM